MFNLKYVRDLFGDYLGDEWVIGNGIRQGGVLSSIMFSFYINDEIQRIRMICLGCQLEFYSINIVAYADDVLLLSPSEKGLQKFIDKVT